MSCLLTRLLRDFIFLLTLADNFGLSRLLAFKDWRGHNFFLNNSDRGNHDVRRIEDLNVCTYRDVRNVEDVMDVKVRNVNVDDIGNLSRFAADLNLANDLLEHSLMFTNTDRFTGEVQRHRDLNLLALDQAGEVGLNQTTPHPINLSIVKHDFACAKTLHIDGKDRVSPCFRTQDNCTIPQSINTGN